MFTSSKRVMSEINMEGGGSQPCWISGINSKLFAPKATRNTVLESNKVRIAMEFERSKYWYGWWKQINPPLDAVINGEKALEEGMPEATEVGDRALKGEFGVTG